MKESQPVTQGDTLKTRVRQGQSAVSPASQPLPLSSYLSTSAVALDLGVHRKTIIRYIVQGHLAASRFGVGEKKRWRILRRDLEAFKRGSRVEVYVPLPRRTR